MDREDPPRLPEGSYYEGAPMQVKPTVVGPTAWARAIKQSHAREIRVPMTEEEHESMRDVVAVVDNEDMTADEKLAEIKRLDPDGVFTKLAVERGELDMKDRRADLARREKLLRSLEHYRSWEEDGTAEFVLQQNECSRLHKLLEACYGGLFYDGDGGKFMWADQNDPQGLANAKVFVVRHDWAAAFGDDHEMFKPEVPFKLPYPVCAFEFKVTGHVVIVTFQQRGEGVDCCATLEGVEGVWFSMGVEAMEPIIRFCERQVRAICIALEAQIAEHEVTRAPAKLNAKRIKEGKPPLKDFHVVDLARRIKLRSRAEARPDAEPTGRRVRMHFRRGHWRHYESHTVWIEWMLVGDPDLGFIDKHYRI